MLDGVELLYIDVVSAGLGSRSSAEKSVNSRLSASPEVWTELDVRLTRRLVRVLLAG